MTRFPFAAGTPRGSTTVRAAKESLAGWIAERDNEGDNTGEGADLVEPRSFQMIGPCAICVPRPRQPNWLEVRWSVELAERQEEAEAEFPDFPF